MFVRGGYVAPGDILYRAGYRGEYWSSVSYSSSRAYYLDFSLHEVSPSYNISQYFGIFVRCVALGG